MIGADFNQASLIETVKTLSAAGIPHTVIHADIGDPGQLIEDLSMVGVVQDEVLHVRSFLDHDRPFLMAEDEAALVARERSTRCNGCYVDEQGGVLPAHVVMQSTVEHLKRWKGSLGVHGLAVLEVHQQDAVTAGKYMQESVSFSFDAHQSMSRQYMVEAGNFLLAAAEGGLFPNLEKFGVYPGDQPYKRITLGVYQPKGFEIRNATLADVPQLVQLEESCWRQVVQSDKLCHASGTVRDRIGQNPEGQYVVASGGKLLAVVYTQNIADPQLLKTSSWEGKHQLHTSNGEWIQLLDIFSVPSSKGGMVDERTMGCWLRDFVKAYASTLPSVSGICGVTRLRHYKEKKGTSYEQHVAADCHDAGLGFHVNAGARVICTIEG